MLPCTNLGRHRSSSLARVTESAFLFPAICSECRYLGSSSELLLLFSCLMYKLLYCCLIRNSLRQPPTINVIISGATGFIGAEVLHQALSHPSIISLICLTRRSLPDSLTSNPKLNVIVLEDFTHYPQDVLQQMEAAECCLWQGSIRREVTYWAHICIVQSDLQLTKALASKRAEKSK